MIFDARLRQEKISSARFCQRLTIVLTNDWCDCVCGKQSTTGLHCGERSAMVEIPSVAGSRPFATSAARPAVAPYLLFRRWTLSACRAVVLRRRVGRSTFLQKR